MLFWRKIFVRRHLARDGSHPTERGAHPGASQDVDTAAHVLGKPHIPAQPANQWMQHSQPKHPIQSRSTSCWIASRKICCCQVPGGESGGGSETATVRMFSLETALRKWIQCHQQCLTVWTVQL